MRKAWLADGRGVGERDYAPGYARLLARGLDPSDPASAEGAALIEAATMLRALIEFDDAGDAA
jgi:exodeoxyribonuclease V gamma subunit